MIAGEVAVHFFEEQFRHQIQIYPDAADFGVRIRNEEHKAEFRNQLRDLMGIYKYVLTKWENGSSTKLFIPFEQEDSVYFGVSLTVTFNRDVRRTLEFISITIERDCSQTDPFQN